MQERVWTTDQMKIIKKYYNNEAKSPEIKAMVDSIIKKFYDSVISNKDIADFYSIANEVFVKALLIYNGKDDFRGLLYDMIRKKCYSHITKLNAGKRTGDREAVSIYQTIENGGTETDLRVMDMIPSKESPFEDEACDMDKVRIKKYLKRLSKKEKEIVYLFMDGYSPVEAKQMLGMTERDFNDCLMSIKSYENVKYLLIREDRGR